LFTDFIVLFLTINRNIRKVANESGRGIFPPLTLMNALSAQYLLERVRRLFGSVPCRLQVAALPWRRIDDGVELLLITSRDTGRWILPKGWPDPGEELCDAAAREAAEEAGVSGAVSRQEAGRYYYAKMRGSGEEVPCEVVVFALEVDAIAEKWKEKRQRKRKWVTPQQAARMLNEPDLCRLISGFAVNPRRSAA
jgi:8-oxo-dGTP pyrophosphatase MutT (NUDIX family)